MSLLTDSAQPTTDAGPGNVPDAPREQPDTSPANVEKAFLTQADFNAAMTRERKRWESDARQRAADDLKVKQGEWETLASERQSKLTQLETELQSRDERLQAFAEEMDKQAKARLRQLPDEIRAMAPEGDVLALYAWLGKAEAAALKLTPKPPTGTLPGPRGNPQAPMATPDDLIARKRASGGYDA